MVSKTVLALSLLLEIFLAISSQVAARDLVETSAVEFKGSAYGPSEGGGGHRGAGYGGRYGCPCCGYYHGRCRCCSAPEEAALVAAENKPQN